MKQYFSFSILLLLLTVLGGACGLEQAGESASLNTSKSIDDQAFPNGVKITIDTLAVPVNGLLKKATLFQDKFYLMFETKRENTTSSFKKMMVFDKSGEFVEDVFLPQGIQDMNHYDIFVENDSLFLKRTQWEEETFVLGKEIADFTQIKRRIFSIYQDSTFKVFTRGYGEWGGTIFFKNTQTEEVYEAASTCPVVINRVKDSYYITSEMRHLVKRNGIAKVDDPTKLHKSQLDFDAEEGSKYHEGIEGLWGRREFYLATSFVANKELRQLYADSTGTYIARLREEKLMPIYKFDFHFLANFNQQDMNGRQVLIFRILKSEDRGVLVIDNGKFNFYLINQTCS